MSHDRDNPSRQKSLRTLSSSGITLVADSVKAPFEAPFLRIEVRFQGNLRVSRTFEPLKGCFQRNRLRGVAQNGSLNELLGPPRLQVTPYLKGAPWPRGCTYERVTFITGKRPSSDNPVLTRKPPLFVQIGPLPRALYNALGLVTGYGEPIRGH